MAGKSQLIFVRLVTNGTLDDTIELTEPCECEHSTVQCTCSLILTQCGNITSGIMIIFESNHTHRYGTNNPNPSGT